MSNSLQNKSSTWKLGLENILLGIEDFNETVHELSLRPRKHNADRILHFIECVDLLKERSQIDLS